MTERTQNIAVGLTVLASMAMLAVLILMFTGLPQMFQRGYLIHMHFPTTGEVKPGDVVHLRGMDVGRIESVDFTDANNPSKGITIVGRVDAKIRLSATTRAHLFGRGLTGGVYVELKDDGPPMINSDTGKPYEYIPTDKFVLLPGVQNASSLLPTEVIDSLKQLSSLAGKADRLVDDLAPALKNFGKLAENINSLLGDSAAGQQQSPAPAASAEGGVAATTAPADAPSAGLKGTLAKLDKVISGLAVVLGDPKTQADLKKALSEMPEALASAASAMNALQEFSKQAQGAMADARGAIKEVGAGAEKFSALSVKMDALVQSLIGSAESISKMMSTLDQAALAIKEGKGTAGKLIYDPELYNNLVDVSKGLSQTVDELRKVLEEWKKQGVPIKLK